MNKLYLITYDLKKDGRDYSSLTAALKLSPHWWHHMDNTWLVKTSETPEQVWNRLAPHMDKGDNMIIIQVTKNYSGWLSQKAWDWIKTNFPE